jgi:hypothetical protein
MRAQVGSRAVRGVIETESRGLLANNGAHCHGFERIIAGAPVKGIALENFERVSA